MKRALEEWIQLRFGLDYEESQDVAQEARLVAFLKQGITSDEKGMPYLQQIAINLVMNLNSKNKRRQAKRHKVLLTEAELCQGADASDLFEDVEDRLLLEQIQQAQIVSECDIALIEKHYMQGYTFEEIAHQMGLRAECLRVRVKRALDKLRAFLTDQGLRNGFDSAETADAGVTFCPPRENNILL